MQRQYLEFELDDDLQRIDFARVHEWLTHTYWSPGITRERVEKGARHSSLVLGAYAGSVQAAYLRVVSDRTRFAYVADVFVADAFRKRGLAKAMLRFALEHPDHQGISKWLLATRDAHDVYRALGFAPLPNPENYLVLKPDPAG
jgi:GNAT superfamily N-acetyltransferase